MHAKLSRSLVLLMLMSCGPEGRHASADGDVRTSAADPVDRWVGKAALDTAAAYRTAIADHIAAMRNRGGSLPDTVYIGRHAEFPEIELPAIIEHTSIRIIAPAVAETLKTKERFTYLNVFGWFAAEQAEFLVVSFGQDMHHWPDGRDDRNAYYRVDEDRGAFVLDRVK